MSYGKGDLTGNDGGFDDIGTSGYNSYPNAAGRPSQADYTRLTQIISTNIDKVSNYVQDIKRLVGQLGTYQDTAELRERLHQRQHYTNQVCKDTADYLKKVRSLPAADSSSDQRHRKTQIQLLTGNFSDVLNSFQTAQREAASTEKECVARARAASAADNDPGSDPLFKLEGDLQDQQQSQITQDELQEIQERETAIRQLEADIVDVNMIFKDLGTMVHEQGDMIDSIEANVDNAEEHVAQGNVQLSQARASQASARKKKCICAIILVVIIIIVVIIIAVSVPKN